MGEAVWSFKTKEQTLEQLERTFKSLKKSIEQETRKIDQMKMESKGVEITNDDGWYEEIPPYYQTLTIHMTLATTIKDEE